MNGNKINPKSMEANILKVGMKRPVPFYVSRGKEILKDTGNVELHALGNAMSIAVSTAESLVHFQYATLDKFETSNIEETNKQGFPQRRNKVVLKLTKAETFEQAHEEYLNSKPSS